MKSCTQIRLNMYNTDANKGASNGHTDKDTLTVLCRNEVQGLQMLSRSGKWVDVEIPQNCFVVIVGDALKGLRAKIISRGHDFVLRKLSNTELLNNITIVVVFDYLYKIKLH
ncbi:hypothetical protein VIGAN_02084300 [Vigna angularis var. angularis]|uniref:Isopenicillin N synthase-like Fe(2+) 2OG dioxygenase domain-containing protein n=1 Tax=Vigna angularis var. angularis TaxID=157739 RepID=A0A0S3RC33_PHAAN|nr:hypothetical protein VIGAN_02084300 [Vigna angularis var. angularis]